MEKLLRGIVEFREKVLPGYRETFAKLALGQTPDSLLLACSDSRVVPNLFASTNPGDLFVVRNVGNLIPPCTTQGLTKMDRSEGAAIEFALEELKVRDVIVCGHSECGAMQALVSGKKNTQCPNLESWLLHGKPALERLQSGFTLNPGLSLHNQLSQVNVLQQLDHLRSYPIVQERLKKDQLRLHGWWFELSRAEVYAFDEELKRIDLIDETQAQRILDRLKRNSKLKP